MIKDIPSSDDFYEAGVDLLNVSWDRVISLALELQDYEVYGGAKPDENEEKEYWTAAKVEMTTAVVVMQQGAEFLLKSKIAYISPFLLIDNSPKDFPKQISGNLFFSDFRTIDAQDLLKVYNTFSPMSIEEEFVNRFEIMRRNRNSIIHTINKNVVVKVHDILVDILEIFRVLAKNDNFIKARREYLDNSHTSLLYSSENVEYRVVREFSKILNILTASELKKYFSVNKKLRGYICPTCHEEMIEDSVYVHALTAFLSPNEPTSDKLRCFICENVHDVLRIDCSSVECKGNVISKEYERCCTCLEYTTDTH